MVSLCLSTGSIITVALGSALPFPTSQHDKSICRKSMGESQADDELICPAN